MVGGMHKYVDFKETGPWPIFAHLLQRYSFLQKYLAIYSNMSSLETYMHSYI